MRLITCLLLISTLLVVSVNAQEVVTSYDTNTLSVLNEELRKNRVGYSSVRDRFDALLPIDISSSDNVTGILSVANGGTGQTTQQASLDALTDATSGTDGQVLTTDGTNASWGDVDELPTYYSGGYELYTDTSEHYINSDTWTKIYDVKTQYGGSFSITWQAKDLNSLYSRGKVYRNGVAVGSEIYTNSTTCVTKGEAVSGWSPGDNIQLYVRSEYSKFGYFKNFTISGQTFLKN